MEVLMAWCTKVVAAQNQGEKRSTKIYLKHLLAAFRNTIMISLSVITLTKVEIMFCNIKTRLTNINNALTVVILVECLVLLYTDVTTTSHW